MQLRSPNHEACLTSITNSTGRFNCRHVHVSKQRSHLRHREWPRLAAAQVSGSASSLDPPSVTSTMESSLDDATKASAADVLRASNIKEVQPAALFDAAHVEEWSPQLVAYFPLGCALAAARFAAWIAGIALDAPWFRQMPVINAYMALLGVEVTWRNTHNIPQQRHVLVSNHVSVDQLPVVPVALRLKTAFPEIKCHTLDSPFLANLFWFSFQPWTEIEAVALPPMRLEPGESKAAFVQRVQLAIAQELQVWVAELNIQQKRAMVQQQKRR
ncbi:hypothetical protein OEZ86_007695 [Tetradesmus obliquus]|nr:hypothetical protein OEZ86_007695 [Tetradesmus obliquus]